VIAGANIINVTTYRVVYYANYLRWFEKGRCEFLRQIGLPYSTIEQQGFHFPVTEVNCRYANSARYDDDVQIATELTELGRASLLFVYRISRESNKRSHFAAGVLTPALTKGDVQPPLETPFNGSTLKSAWSTTNNDLLATGSTKHACIDQAGKVARIPAILLDALKAAAR